MFLIYAITTSGNSADILPCTSLATHIAYNLESSQVKVQDRSPWDTPESQNYGELCGTLSKICQIFLLSETEVSALAKGLTCCLTPGPHKNHNNHTFG